MDENRFWQIVDATLAAGANRKRQYCLLADQLRRLSPTEVAEFHWWFQRQLERSDCSNVEAAWDVIDGVGADDGYFDFRCWLVSRGRAVFESALSDPDSLADVVQREERTQFFDFDCADAVYEELTGQECPPDPVPHSWEEEDSWDAHDGEEQRRRMPRLWAMFDDDGE